jgi:hypothetical protein
MRWTMTNDKIIGVMLGSIVCAVVIAGNIRRADPHGGSVYPDVLSLTVAPLVVYVVGRRRRLNGESLEAVQAFGARVGAIAGAVFAAGVGAFAWYWLAAWPLWAFSASVAFISVFVLSCFSAYVAAHKRIMMAS